MFVTKNRAAAILVSLLAVVVFVTACGPPGPHALLKGRRLLEAGQTEAALTELKTATALLPTNAAAWNYLGFAYHRSGQLTNAADAYSRALKLDRDLLEARYNLGCLWLDLGKLDAAKIELTAYTLRRGNAVEGWLKLGSAQLRGRETTTAEKSFREALRVEANNVEALNGLGLLQLQRNRPREAADFFASALKLQPDYRPALLNLATVSQQHLNDRAEALRRYREYLALKPRPADADVVSTIVQSLEPAVVAKVQPSAPTNATVRKPTLAKAAPATNQSKPAVVTATNRVAPTPGAAVTTVAAKPASAPVFATPATASPPPQPEVVKLKPEPAIKTVPDATRAKVARPVKANPTANATPTPSGTPLTKSDSGGIVSNANSPATETKAPASSTALSSPASSASVSPVASASARSSGRYTYVSPATPKPGNRREAEFAFAQGQQAQRANRPAEALQSFRRATQLDPAYFEAYYSVGLAAFSLRSFSVGLSAWEHALALQPDNSDARYNFALTLKAANYPQDAADELEKLLALHPDEARGHLTLGNLYAGQLRDIPRARRHYNKVLQLDPRNPQAQSIRYWLVANPG